VHLLFFTQNNVTDPNSHQLKP